jgi:hypothetical protein
VIELYAVIDRPGPPLPELASVHAVVAGGLAAVCGPAPEAELSAELLWRHEEVVEALMDDRDVLPVRYGTRLNDDREVERVLTERHDDLAVRLDIIRGAVELSVRVMAGGVQPTTRPNSIAGGTEYLRSRGRDAGAAGAAARAIHEPLSALARAALRRRSTVRGELLRAAYLVDRQEAGRFAALAAQLQAENPAFRLLCTGPWPAYSFAER